jgi:hypothetical protein
MGSSDMIRTLGEAAEGKTTQGGPNGGMRQSAFSPVSPTDCKT